MKQLDLFTYQYEAFQNGDTPRIQKMNEYKSYMLKQISLAANEEKKKQWENALKSIEQQIKDFMNE